LCAGVADSDALSRLSPVLEQLDILEIQQTAIRQLTTEQEAVATAPVATVTAAEATKAGAAQSAAVIADADDSGTEAEQAEAADSKTDAPKPTGSSAASTADGKKGKVSAVNLLHPQLLVKAHSVNRGGLRVTELLKICSEELMIGNLRVWTMLYR
jgi:hypothetical protein